jgi:hypothetical protein
VERLANLEEGLRPAEEHLTYSRGEITAAETT